LLLSTAYLDTSKRNRRHKSPIMDMGTATMAMNPTAATGSSSAATSAATSMGGMGNGCKISMLWNWNTIDACFISSQWRITSAGVFAGSCIGVILLVMCLELLRRAVKEYDRFIVRRHIAALDSAQAHAITREGSMSSKTGVVGGQCMAPACAPIPTFRPSLLQQAVRALLHMLQFAVAYFIMLLAMYYNGYIIICIFIGSYIGAFVFQWETLRVPDVRSPTSAANEATACCG
jgi:copper transporter 1